MTTAPTLSSFTSPVGSGWAGQTWDHNLGQDVNDANTCEKVFEHTNPNESDRGITLIYYKTGPKIGKQFVNVNYPSDNNDNPSSISNVTQGTGGQTGTDEVEYTTGDQLKFWMANYNSPLIDITTTAAWNFTHSPSVSITSGRTQNRVVTAQISNAAAPNYAYLVDRDPNTTINVGGQIKFKVLDSYYFTTGSGGSHTLSWTAPSDQLTGSRTYGIYVSDIYVTTAPDWGSDQTIPSLNPGWDISNQWTLNGSTLSVSINNGTCIENGDEFYIGDSQGNIISNATTETVGTNYNGPWGAFYNTVTLDGTIPLNTTETYDVYIKSSTATTAKKAVNWTSNDSYTHAYNPPSIATTVANWLQNGATVTIPVTVSNFGANDKAELWVGGVYHSDRTTSGDLTYNFTQTTGSTVFEVKYNDGTTVSSLNPVKQNSYSYTVPPTGSVTVSGFSANSWTETGAGANGNSVSVTFTVVNNTNPPQGNIFALYTGTTQVDSQVVSGGTHTVTLSAANAGQSTTYSLWGGAPFGPAYLSPTFTTAALTQPATPSYTAGALTYDQVAGTVTSNISGTANLGSNNIELWVAGSKADERNTDGALIYTFSTTPYNTTLGPFNFEVKITGGSATQTLSQDHNTGADPNPPTQQPSVSYAPAKGGRKRRFPIISTQLFNRQRSVYSIGTTHHELAPQF